MKKIVSILIIITLSIILVACSNITYKENEPQLSQMKAISELAVMECYYHNVAKYNEKNAEKVLWWTNDRRFWVEYSGIVKIGIDASLVKMDVDDDIVTISIPQAKVLDCKVDEKSLSKNSYVVDKDSADIEAEHQTEAFKTAQNIMKKKASEDKLLLDDAQQRAQKLLEEYVKNVGAALGKTYKIKWIYLENEE